MKKRLLGTTACIVTVGAVVTTALMMGGLPGIAGAENAVDITKEKPVAAKTADRLSQLFRAVAKEMRPAVVSIRSTSTIQPAARAIPPQLKNLPKEFRGFFDDDAFGKLFENQPNRSYRRQGTGTGVIVSSEGHIVTNNHVVRGADEVKVTLADKRTFVARVVGTDPKTDVAVLKIKAKGLAHAKLGNSDAMDVGDWVLAIGSPFGLNQTVTAGIVSAKGRENVGITDYEDFIQTDAAINPGNSGGPLVNLRGEVIGINTAIASRSGGSMGVGFAIPSNMVRRIKDSILMHGRVERGRIGAAIQDLNAALARSFGFKLNGSGVLVGDVVAGGPAEKAGLKAGDIVLEIDGRPMRSAAKLRNTVAATTPGTTIRLKIFRNGERRELPVKVGRLEEQAIAKRAVEEPAVEQSDDLGLTLRDLTPELSRKLGLGEADQGAVVTRVEPNSIAADASIRTGDLIVSVDGQAVQDVAAFRAAMKKQDLSRGIRMQIKTQGLKRFVFIRKSR